jgi:uncharacterized protein YegP (UPF0339 family)
MPGKFTIKKSGDQFQFSLTAANGEKLLASERYVKKASATAGIQSVKTNAPIDARYEKKASKANQPYFVLKAANNEIIGTSEMYSYEAARDGGIASVKANAPAAEIVDQAT